MDTAMLTASIQNALTQISAIRSAEQETRDAVSNTGIEQTIKLLFPGVDSEFVKSNQFFPNVLQRCVNRYVGAVTRAELNWEWTLEGDPPEEGSPAALLDGPGRDLLQAATVDGLTTGKYAFFPYIDDAGALRISVLSGFLWPIFAPGNSTVVEALLQITSGLTGGKVRYEVRRYSLGMLEVFSDLEDWKKYATTTAKEYPQRHAPDRLPVAFRITGRDANRQPEGIAATAMPAFLDYIKARVLMSFTSELGSFEERTFYSDEIFKLAKEFPNHPLLAALKKVGPRQGKFMPSGDKYERLPPIDLKGYQERAREARENVESAMNIPAGEGGELSGLALQEMREAYSETATSYSNSEADALTEACQLAAALSPTTIKPGWKITLKTRFTQDVASERAAIREDYVSGILLKSAALSGLQGLGVSYVTDEQITLAQQQEEAALVPTGEQ